MSTNDKESMQDLDKGSDSSDNDNHNSKRSSNLAKKPKTTGTTRTKEDDWTGSGNTSNDTPDITDTPDVATWNKLTKNQR